MEQENTELEYLKGDNVGKIIAKGLAELYEVQPKFPVDYLAKWLLNFSVAGLNEGKLDEQEQYKQELKQVHQQNIEKEVQQEAQVKEQKLTENEINEKFELKIKQHEYHNELVVDEFPEFLESRTGLTGCYIGNLDYSVRDVHDEDEDEKAHLNLEQPKVINYIGYSQSQQPLMQGKTLSLEQGVTGEVFVEKTDQQQEDPENPDEIPAPKQNYVYIPDLVKEPKMQYFRLPKLGAYLAVPLIYNSCLIESHFDAALEERIRYQADKAEKEKEKEQKELDFQEQLKTMEENGDDTTEFVAEYEAQKAALEEAVEAPFNVEKKEYVVCCDTMGQDQPIKEENIQYLEKFTQLFAQSWEERERDLLSQDIDKQIAYIENLPAKYVDLVEQFAEQEEQNAQDKEGNFAELKESNEKEYDFELNCARLEKVREQLTDKTNQDYFLGLKDYRVIKFPTIIQNVLYLLGYRREEINLPNTHVLNWKLVRSKILNEQFFEKVLNYSHRGSKKGAIPPYQLVNRITEKIARFEQETVDSYNITFGRLLRWLRLTTQLRKLDIEIRREKIAQRKLDRQQKLEQNETIREEKAKALEERLAEIQTEEDKEGFDEAEWEKVYDEEHPLQEIPEEVQDEDDDDCEFTE